MNSCKDCKHYNGGAGEACCDFCDPPFEDWFESKEEEEWQDKDK